MAGDQLPTAECERSQAARVLLVEDEMIVAWDLSETLKRIGFEVIGTADSGAQAIEMAIAFEPDLILMDIRLVGPLDGVEAAQVIRERLGKSVIYLTAHADSDTLKRAALTQPLGYVFKPYNLQVLRTALDQAIRRQRKAPC